MESTLIYILAIIGLAVGSIYALWFFYLAIMNLKRAKDGKTMTKFAYFAALPMAVSGYILDIVVNITLGSIMFLEFPHYKRMTLSARMSYHYNYGATDWRSVLAEWLAKNLLDPYDPSGRHID